MDVSNIASPLKYVLLFLVLILVQVLICNNILLFGIAIPFIFIYFIIVLPLDTNQNFLMIMAFLMGFLVDLFSDTLGLNAMACLLLSVIKKPIFYSYMSKDDKFLTAVPCISTMGWFDYLKFVLTLSAVYCFLVFGIELFSFTSLGHILAMAAASTLFTTLLILASDALFNK